MHVRVDASLSRIHRSQTCVDILCYCDSRPSPPLQTPPPPPIVRRRPLLPEICFRPTRRGESVRAEFVEQLSCFIRSESAAQGNPHGFSDMVNLRIFIFQEFFSYDLLSEMASAFITNALQVNFDSVLGISDNDEMVNMFKALESTGPHEPGMAEVAIVKKFVSKKRSVSTAVKDTTEVQVETAAPAVKKKRTTTGKASKKRDLGLVSVAQEAVPIHMIEPISSVPAERPPAPKRNVLKRKFRMPAGFDDEIVEKEPAMETGTGEIDVEGQVEKRSDETERVIRVTADEFDAPDFHVFTNEAERQVETGRDTEDEMETAMKEESELLSKVLEKSVSPTSDDESLSLEEHLAQIPDGMMLPSLTAVEPTKIKFCRGIEIRGVEADDWYKANLPKITATNKGKKPLEEPDTVKGHPACEQFQFICGDIDFLILLREKVITEITSFFHSFSLRNIKGGNDKKGEVGSSHGRGQPPPGDGGSSCSRSEPSRKRGSSGSKQREWRYWIS
ncbi:G-type lectin S-receptor-like serine/threonine-protein kinase-like [Dorcoceras hygrometricum]|uniref:G-type lectin S-receptor-like serine/threonine-protein kinase-like n=1 Tax=Dorcoceras hygrometricum TaxID=472368 RepID=A0A2Z7BCR7_9LAMI|nr:G-type lectin S-receptor-like serine/threonine-protein kinase-like [Dorcoceras hygrometricum]